MKIPIEISYWYNFNLYRTNSLLKLTLNKNMDEDAYFFGTTFANHARICAIINLMTRTPIIGQWVQILKKGLIAPPLQPLDPLLCYCIVWN